MDHVAEGSCLCGRVAFRISGAFERFFLCHCKRCRKGTGSAHAANLFAPAGRLDWLSGADLVSTYRVADTRHQRSFCSACGSAVPNKRANGAGLVVPAGCLDSAVALRPDAHIFDADRAEWDAHLEDVPRLPGRPG
ncbi:GFA family protein [Oceanibacterium hippocampi]|uniref:Glutathione-dependent formaldehyde-activating enzyme n=1 Tax=Oceanibacterium hippocampi TaxID=745714 RepID=A0A1Y5S734_9PROT|nr:GFA family protein [Oceanibacterium hippocampi]SLN31632.1 Glutathione-dependent formaldehyde-activating enzyme [Oceanibacterium hippocampi]